METAAARTFALASIGLGLYLYFVPAASLPLQRTNEAMYAYPPIAMLATGDYFVPRYESGNFLEKPPLAWWIIAASYRFFGITVFAERLPAVLASLATVLLLGLWVRRRSGPRAGLFSALVLMFTLQFSVFSRTFAADAFLALGVALAVAALDDACRREGHDAVRALAAGAALALAFYFKGLVGIVLPAGAVAAGLLIDRAWPKQPLRRGAWALASLLALLAPWHIVLARRLGMEFWRSFYWSNQFLRGATSLYMGTSSRGPFFYLAVLAWSAFPWSLLLAASLRRRRTSSVALGLLLFGLLFWSLLVMKREVYLMPLYPAAAVLVGEAAASPIRKVIWRRLPWIAGAVIAAAAAVLWALAFPGFGKVVGQGLALFVGIGIVSLAAALAASARAPGKDWTVPATAFACGLLFVSLALCEGRLARFDPLPEWGERLRSECRGGCDGFLLGLDAYSLDFYTRFEWTWVADPEHELPPRIRHRKAFLVMWSDLEPMLAHLPFPWRVVEKRTALTGQWAAAALGVGRGSPFQSLSLVELLVAPAAPSGRLERNP